MAHRCTPASHTLTLTLCLTNSACIPVRKLNLRWWGIPLRLCVTLGTKKMCLELTSCHDFHEGVSGFRLIMVDLVGRSVASPSSARLINCTLKVSCWELGRRQLNGPPSLACLHGHGMDGPHGPGRASRAPPEYWSQRRERGQRVCVDKLGANTESSIVKTGLARVQKSKEGPKKVDKSRFD